MPSSQGTNNVLNSKLFDLQKIESSKKEFNEHSPFPLLRLDSFLDTSFLSKLQSSVEEDITFQAKDNDLYRFCQSYGLQDLDPKTALHQLTKALYSDKFRDLLYQITGIRVSDTPDLFASCYTDTSYLLCHDDQIEDRRIAFILYLVPEDWTESDGGGLNIYDSFTPNPKMSEIDDSTNSNRSNVRYQTLFPMMNPLKTLIPQRNSVVLFKVSDRSFHAVDEVLSADKKRIAIGGWWHDEKTEDTSTDGGNAGNLEIKPTIKAIPDPVIEWKEAIESSGDSKHEMQKLMEKWLNPTYLKKESMKKLQSKFMEESHLTLMDFLNEELYYKLMHQMCSIPRVESKDKDSESKIFWKLKGPIHRRLYRKFMITSDVENEEGVALVLEFRKLMESMEWKEFIQNITSLELGSLTLETRRFEHGHYTIAHDLDRVKDVAGLDVNLQFIEKEDSGWDPYFGGSIHYTMGKQEDDHDQNDNESDEEERNEDGEMNDSDEDDKKSMDNDESDSKDDSEGESEEEDGEMEDDNIIMSVHPFPNTLSLTYRADKGVMSFVKYLNHHAPCSKMDINQIWQIQEDSSDCDVLRDDNAKNLGGKKRKLNNDTSLLVPSSKKQKLK